DSLPNFTPTYGPETVLEEEIGFKSDFELGGMVGQLNADIFNNQFSNITEPFTGVVGSNSVLYNENIAAARLRGFEMETTLIPATSWEIRAGYSYNDAAYTSWIGEDPFNVAQPLPGQGCVVIKQNACFLDLKNNPFPYAPRQQGHVVVTYRLPVDERL